MWKQSKGACYFSLKAAVLFKRDFSQCSTVYGAYLVRKKGSAILQKLRPFFILCFITAVGLHSDYSTCGRSSSSQWIRFFFLLLYWKYSPHIHMWLVWPWSLHIFLILKYNTSAFSAHISEVLEKQTQLWFKATRGTPFIMLFLGYHPA